MEHYGTNARADVEAGTVTPAPTDAEAAEMRRLCDEATPLDRSPAVWACIERNARFVEAAREWLPRLLDLVTVTKEGGDANNADAQVVDKGRDIAPPARSENAPARATDPDEAFGDALAAAGPKWQSVTPSAPVPEGMETTVEGRIILLSLSDTDEWVSPSLVNQIIRDLDRALAEIARLTAALAEAKADMRGWHEKYARCVARAKSDAAKAREEGFAAGQVFARSTP